MSENSDYETVAEDLDVRKPRARLRRAGASQSRKGILAVAELLGGLSYASAEAFRSLNSALTAESVTQQGLGASLFVGIREGNVRFLEELPQTSRRVFDAVRQPRPGEETGVRPGVGSVSRQDDATVRPPVQAGDATT